MPVTIALAGKLNRCVPTLLTGIGLKPVITVFGGKLKNGSDEFVTVMGGGFRITGDAVMGGLIDVIIVLVFGTFNSDFVTVGCETSESVLFVLNVCNVCMGNGPGNELAWGVMLTVVSFNEVFIVKL